MFGKEKQLKKKDCYFYCYRLFTKENLKCQNTGCGYMVSVLFLILSELDTVRVPAATHRHTSVLFESMSMHPLIPLTPTPTNDPLATSQ